MVDQSTAIVILNYNGQALLRQFLPSVMQWSEGARIIVADNGSTDGSLALLRDQFPVVEVILVGENLGFCGGYNFALRQVTASYYILLNSDVEVTEGWLAPMISTLEHDSSIAAVQPKILAFKNRNQFEYAGGAGGFMDALGYPFCRGRIFDTVEIDAGQYNDTRPVFWATGACLAIRADEFHGSGGFDEDFFAHMEEIDLCWKIQRKGKQVFYTGESTVYHVGGGTLSKLNPAKTYLNFRNGLTLIFKNMGTGELLWKLPVRMALDWLALITFMLRGSPANAGAVIRAHAHFIRDFSHNLKKRNLMKGSAYQHKPHGIYPGALVWDYFGRGRRDFRTLKF